MYKFFTERKSVTNYAQLAGATLYETGCLLHKVETERDRLRKALIDIENTPLASIDNQVAASVRCWKNLVTDMRDQASAAL